MTDFPETLDRLAQLHREATAGPWLRYSQQRRERGCNCITIDCQTGESACPVHGTDHRPMFRMIHGDICIIHDERPSPHFESDADVELLIALRNALPDLLRAARLAEAVKAMTPRLQRWQTRTDAPQTAVMDDFKTADMGEKLLRDLLALLTPARTPEPR